MPGEIFWEIQHVCRMLPLGISAFRLLPGQICTILISAGFLNVWLFVKYLQLSFLRCFSSIEYWKMLKTYWIVLISSESGMTAAKGFVHSGYCILLSLLLLLSSSSLSLLLSSLSLLLLFLFYYLIFIYYYYFVFFFAWEEFWNCEWQVMTSS